MTCNSLCCASAWEVCRPALLFETSQRLQSILTYQMPPAPQDLLACNVYGRAACSTAEICCRPRSCSGWHSKLAVFGVIWPMGWIPKCALCLQNLKRAPIHCASFLLVWGTWCTHLFFALDNTSQRDPGHPVSLNLMASLMEQVLESLQGLLPPSDSHVSYHSI